MKLLNFFIDYLRRYGRSKRYKLSYKPILKTLSVWCNGLLMEKKKDYKYNKKLNAIDLTFLPIKGTKVRVQGIYEA